MNFISFTYKIDSQKHEEKGAEPMERKSIPVGYEDRPDLVLREKKFRGQAMILELKIADRLDQMQDSR